jgi:polysaccharide pyruvyl transferase WcaK-like protein
MITVEIKGIGFPNKGAELMLNTIMSEFQSRNVEARFVVEPSAQYRDRVSFPLYQRTRFFIFDLNFGFLFELLPRKIKRRLGFVGVDEIDLVIDASGFAYGDVWGHNKITKGLAGECQKLKRMKVPIIMLPQAFGPFSNKKIRKTCARMINCCELVFVRDKYSLNYLQSLELDKKFEIYPDITCGLSLSGGENYQAYSGRVAVIPNAKMLEKGGYGEDYLQVLIELIEYLLNCGLSPFVLNHEGEPDRRLIESLQQRLREPIEVVSGLSAVQIKQLISQCRFVISSRFHGLVSSLSSGVPAVAIGWSHKYQALMEDFGVKHLLANVDFSEVRVLIDSNLISPDVRAEISRILSKKSDSNRESLVKMWDEVFALVETRSHL